MVKLISLLTILLFASVAEIHAQSDLINNVDSSNYYSYYRQYPVKGEKRIKTSWLKEDEVTKIISEELANAKYEWIYEHSLYKLDSNQYIVLSVFCRKSNFGFIYMQGHSSPRLNHRYGKTFDQEQMGVDYAQVVETFPGETEYIKIKKLPSNIFVLRENCYWYQESDIQKNNEILISKEIAIKILRQDIRKALLEFSLIKK